MLGLETPGQLLSQRLAGKLLGRSSEGNGAGPDARKSQSQVFLLRRRCCQRLRDLGSKQFSLKLHHQLNSILSPQRLRAPLHPETPRRSLMVYVRLPRPPRWLATCGQGASNATTSFDRALAFLPHAEIERSSGLLEPNLGFVAKSAFWLGLVYSAMPFDAASPTAVRPTGTATSPAASSSLANLAGAIAASQANQADWKSAVEAATALCAHNCYPFPPAGLAHALARKDPVEPPRRLTQVKSSRQGAVRPLAANHIRSTDGQT
jgi:hypothetical protein